jgi:tetratricopeptide (TPR) repeat protein
MKKILYILVVCATVFTSCTKFLDIKPYGEVIPKTADEFSSLLNTILENIDYGEEVIIGNPSSAVAFETYADNFEANLTVYPAGNSLALYIGTRLSNQQYLYSNLYEVIRDCNIVIDNLQERDTRLGKDILGTAYALRGICYYNLLRNFSEPPVGNMQGDGVPLVTKFDMEERPIRSSIEKTFAQAESDMLKAIGYDIEDPIYRFNTDVMEGFLARLYFWTGKWGQAQIYAEKVLKKYPLLKGDSYLEMMTSRMSPKGNMVIKGFILSESSSLTDYNGTESQLTARPVSRRFVELFVEKQNDIRYELSFNRKREHKKNGFGCLRSAEMQLILAESLYHGSDHPGALAALNDLRRNRIEGVEDYTMETLPPVNPEEYITVDVYGEPLTPLLNAILNERRKELFMEGDRWYELKRNGRPEFWAAKQGRKYTTYKFMYTFPLPVQDVELVEGLKQNPGYDKVQ